MGQEYRIRFSVPADYDASALVNQLPRPYEQETLTEIYGYVIESDGFHFVDYLVNPDVASIALKRFIDEALRMSESVEVWGP